MITHKSKDDIIKEKLTTCENQILESEIFEEYFWARHLEMPKSTTEQEKEANAVKLESVKYKRNRQDNLEPFANYLRKQLDAIKK